MAERAKAMIMEIEASHVVMVSEPQAVTDVILEAVAMVRDGARRPVAVG